MSVMQLKRGSTASVATYTPAMAELVLDTSLNQLHIGDGVTAGGYRIAAPLSVQGVSLAAASTPAVARAVIIAAASGDNTDITSITGSAASLTTSRSISATGDAAWTVSFNGTANATAALTLANTGVGAGTYGSVTVNAKGLVTAASTITPLANGGTGIAADAFTNLTLANSWAVISTRRAGYRLVTQDTLYLEVQIAGGTATDGTVIGTLPAGRRPPNTVAIVVQSAPATTPSSSVAMPRIVIDPTTGNITCQNCTSGGGIQFITTLSLV